MKGKTRFYALACAIIALASLALPYVSFNLKPNRNTVDVVSSLGINMLSFWPVMAIGILAVLMVVAWFIPNFRVGRQALGIICAAGTVVLVMFCKKVWWDAMLAGQILGEYDIVGKTTAYGQTMSAYDLKFLVGPIVSIIASLAYAITSAMESKVYYKDFRRDKYLYLLILPGIVWFIIFCYIPMYGVQIAFKDFSMAKGIEVSPWVGFLQFETLFSAPTFPQVLRNTFIISILKLIFSFPAPIILALLLNELRQVKFKKVVQTVLYLPHFISWVVLAGLLSTFLHPTTGFVNEILTKVFGMKPINFLAEKSMFRGVLIITDIYKGMGWGTIVYLAALSSVDVEQYEAAVVDGANKWQQVWHITLPAIRSVMVILFILSLGNILSAGFDQIFNLYNSSVYEVADIIDTYVYRQGIVSTKYSLSSAAGLFKSLVALVLITLTNYAARLLGEEGLW